MLDLIYLGELFLLANQTGEQAAEKTPSLMDFHVSMIFYTFVGFIIFLWVMTRYVWKPIAQQLRARADKIRKNLDDAEKAKQEAEEIRKGYEERLKKIHEEIEQLRREGREQAERLKAQIEQKAREEAKEIIERAKREIELEKKGAISELRNATLENALKIASELLKKSLTDEDHKKLAEEIFEHIDEIPAI